SLKVLELELLATPIDRTVDALIQMDPIFAATGARVFDDGLGRCLEPDVEVAVHLSMIRGEGEIGLQVRRESDINVPIQRAEGHRLLSIDSAERHQDPPVKRMGHGGSGNVAQGHRPIDIIYIDLSVDPGD